MTKIDLEDWLKKVHLKNNNIKIVSNYILLCLVDNNYLFDASKYSNVLCEFDPEHVEISSDGDILTFITDDEFNLLSWLVGVPNKDNLNCDVNLTKDIFEDFINKSLKNKPKELRKGQFVFNLVDSIFGSVAREVQFIKKVDCFYDDNKIQEFIDCSYELIKEKEWL